MQIAVWSRRIAAFAVLLNIAAIGTRSYLDHKFAAGAVSQPSGTIVPATGVTTNGQVVLQNPARPCHIVRYTSIHCAYCRRDQPLWERLEATLTKKACDSISLGPLGSDMPKDAAIASDHQILVAVPAAFARKIDLFATPTTVVLDRNWNVIWSRVGVLDPNDIEEAEAALHL